MKKTITLESLDFELQELFRSEVEGADDGLQALPKMGSQGRVFQSAEVPGKVERKFGLRAGQDQGTGFFRALKPKARMQREAINSAQIEIKTAAASPSRLHPGGGIQGEKYLRKERALANPVEKVCVFRRSKKSCHRK